MISITFTAKDNTDKTINYISIDSLRERYNQKGVELELDRPLIRMEIKEKNETPIIYQSSKRSICVSDAIFFLNNRYGGFLNNENKQSQEEEEERG